MEHIENLQSVNSKAKKKSGDDAHNQKWAILSLSSIPLVMTLGNSMLIPVLPAMENKLNITSFQSSMIITVYSIVAILLIPIAGFLSDHIGRKKSLYQAFSLRELAG